MAIAEEAAMEHTVMAACGHGLEMATRLVEPPVDYLESGAQHVTWVKDNVSYIVAHGNPCYSVS
jgi:hypothetical protein